MSANLIPSIGPQGPAAGLTPAQIHQGAPAGIPMHPAVTMSHVQAPQAIAQKPDPSTDFFARAAVDDFFGDADDPPAPEAPVFTPPPSTDLVNSDDLLQGGQFPEEPVAAIPQGQPQAPAAPVAQPQAPAPQAPQAPAPQPSFDLDAIQRQAMDHLRNNVYRFDDDTSRRALTEPEVVLPELAARLHMNLITEFGQQVQRVVPTLVEREVQRRTAVMETKNEFFRRYPKLNRPEWDSVISESVAMAAQMHPGQTRDVIMREGATLAAYRIRSQFRAPPAQNRPQPFVPANPGGGAPFVPTNPQQPANPWAELAADPDLF